jgi:hypothetical protein
MLTCTGLSLAVPTLAPQCEGLVVPRGPKCQPVLSPEIQGRTGRCFEASFIVLDKEVVNDLSYG